MKPKIIKPIILASDVERGIVAEGMDYFLIEDIRAILANFREKSQNITLEKMDERDGMFVEYGFWIGEAINLQKRHIATAEKEFEKKSFDMSRKLIKGYKDYPKMAATDANRNAAIFLKDDKQKIIDMKFILHELQNIDDTLFKAINRNARAMKNSQRIR